MTTQLEVSAETARLLLNSAARRQLSLDEYLRSLVEASTPTLSAGLSLEEFERDLDQLADQGRTLPILPDDFSRADIYSDHD